MLVEYTTSALLMGFTGSQYSSTTDIESLPWVEFSQNELAAHRRPRIESVRPSLRLSQIHPEAKVKHVTNCSGRGGQRESWGFKDDEGCEPIVQP